MPNCNKIEHIAAYHDALQSGPIQPTLQDIHTIHYNALQYYTMQWLQCIPFHSLHSVSLHYITLHCIRFHFIALHISVSNIYHTHKQCSSDPCCLQRLDTSKPPLTLPSLIGNLPQAIPCTSQRTWKIAISIWIWSHSTTRLRLSEFRTHSSASPLDTKEAEGMDNEFAKSCPQLGRSIFAAHWLVLFRRRAVARVNTLKYHIHFTLLAV